MRKVVTCARAASPESRAFFKALGAHIEKLRKARGWTQAELARACGVSQQAIFAYELGERRPTVLILVKMSKALTVPIEKLVGMTEPIKTREQRASPRAVHLGQRIQALSQTKRQFIVRILSQLEEAAQSAPVVITAK
jgi:putative transcriptional regulator